MATRRLHTPRAGRYLWPGRATCRIPATRPLCRHYSQASAQGHNPAMVSRIEKQRRTRFSSWKSGMETAEKTARSRGYIDEGYENPAWGLSIQGLRFIRSTAIPVSETVRLRVSMRHSDNRESRRFCKARNLRPAVAHKAHQNAYSPHNVPGNSLPPG